VLPTARPLMSSVLATPNIPESLGAQPFLSLLDRPTVLPAARPVMSSALAVLTIPESSWARTFLSLLKRPAALPAVQPPMLDPFLLDGKATPLILDDTY
jgi:hypothetical protein